MAERLRVWLAGGHECDLDLGEGSAQDLMEKIENVGDRSWFSTDDGRCQRLRANPFSWARVLSYNPRALTKPAAERVPRRSYDQRLDALRQANEVRIARAALKKELAAGKVRLEAVLARPPGCAGRAKVYELLLAIPKIGPWRASRLLSQCQIAPGKTVAGLSERQRNELIDALRL
jgi:hypothetical protein